MHPHRYSARPAAAAESARALRRPEPIGAFLLAVGGLVALAGTLSADGTELSVGALMIMAAIGRARLVRDE